MAERRRIVLILCTGNSCRSQMAEAFLRKYQGDKWDVHSAGMHPKAETHPLAVRVMAEVGLDIAHQQPKGVNVYLGRHPVAHIIIVCDKANDTCPRIWPGAFTRSYMPVEDPAEVEGTEQERLEVFRRVRDELDRAMKTWEPKPEDRF